MARGYPDFEGPKSGLYLKPEWAAKEGLDKNIRGVSAAVAANVPAYPIDYTVPEGKTLVINHVGTEVIGQTGNIVVRVNNVSTGDVLACKGGVQGTFMAFPKPLVVSSEENVKIFAVHFGAGLGQVGAHIGGYEY